MRKIILCWTVLLFLLVLTSCEEEKADFDFHRRLIVVPVSIEGKSYSFLFDTGGGTSTISRRIAVEHELKSTPSNITTYDISEGRKRTIMLSEPLTIEAAGKQITTQFDVPASYQNTFYDGIIAMDIIRKYNWLFDFEEKTLSISDGLLFPSLDNSWTKQASYRYSTSFGVPFVSMSFNSAQKQDFYFDTGMYDGFYDGASQKNLHYSFVFNEHKNSAMSRFRRFMTSEDKLIQHITTNDAYHVLYSMNSRINDVEHSPFAAAIYTNGDKQFNVLKQRKLLNIVTVNYLHYFDGMYIDTKLNRISLYTKNEHTRRDKGENVQWFYQKHVGGFNEVY